MKTFKTIVIISTFFCAMAHAENERLITPSGHVTGYYVEEKSSFSSRDNVKRVVTPSGHPTPYYAVESPSSSIPTTSPGYAQLSTTRMTTQSPNVMQQATGTGAGVEALGGALSRAADSAYESAVRRDHRDAPYIEDQISSGLRVLQGQNIEIAINVLGKSFKKEKSGDFTIYHWTNNIYFLSGNYCNINILVREDGIIENFDWEGTTEGSRTYAKKLNRYSAQYVKSTSLGVQRGMSEQEVKGILGENAEIQNTPLMSIWFYHNKAELVFKRNSEEEEYILDNWRLW